MNFKVFAIWVPTHAATYAPTTIAAISQPLWSYFTTKYIAPTPPAIKKAVRKIVVSKPFL
ncbi:unannotated protein [freshwater metagenome]|uniref:Unannotated protein n=1 Tax=freshwater metagenome TaxID=449393 RepID=A0A6J6HQP8_9ZZZZ